MSKYLRPPETPETPGKRELNRSTPEKKLRLPLWQALLLPTVSISIFFCLLEVGLALFGIKPALKTEDPFVGFSSNIPLFVPATGPAGTQMLTTASNKLGYFNAQSFPRAKGPNTYRIFTVGGSTTYGRPYDDQTSFSSWLRELLPFADREKNWEVINAGGISYASYRVAHLMEELISYQPDLFIIYTGHNEFLEERTYRQIREMSPFVRSTVSILAKTRTWSAMSVAMQKLGLQSDEKTENRDNRDKLGVGVDAILDKSAGLNRYTRDDALRRKILEHYRISLERMVTLARSAGAEVLFITPASSLKDCTPFKSEHAPGLDSENRERSEQMLAQAKADIDKGELQSALVILETATALDPRHAELHYRRGQVLLALGRSDEAAAALQMAINEDICPLRALTPMRQIVTEVADEYGVDLIDYVALLEQHMQKTKGHPIPGEELFLDHVHPTIEGHEILAVAIVKAMIDQGLVQAGPHWSDQSIAAVEAKFNDRIDQKTHGQALANLARVLLWAGKLEDAARSARQAQETAGNVRQVAVDSASILASVASRQNQFERANQILYSTLESAPGAIELRLKLAENLLQDQFLQLEKAAANLLLVSQQRPTHDRPQGLFGFAMSKRGRLGVAYASLLEALRLNPKNAHAQWTLAQVKKILNGQEVSQQLPVIRLETYLSNAPRKLRQLIRSDTGRFVPHGIEVEFYENGRLKHFLDVKQGKPHGYDMTWDQEGNLLSRQAFLEGVPFNQ